MKINKDKMTHRQSVNGIVINGDGEFLLVQKKDYADHQWDFPRGGIDDGEDAKTAVLRELQEELGTNKFEIVAQCKVKDKFDWDKGTVERNLQKYGHSFKGSECTQFLVKFTGKKSELKPDYTHEFKRVIWVHKNELENYLNFENQKETVRKTFADLKNYL